MNITRFKEDMIYRTLKNLKVIDGLQKNQCKNCESKHEIYEVTQLINSLLSLLIIPRERGFGEEELENIQHWFDNGFLDKMNECVKSPNNPLGATELFRRIRNSIAHARFNFSSNDKKQIDGVIFADDRGGRNVTFEESEFRIELPITVIREMVQAIAKACLRSYSPPKVDNDCYNEEPYRSPN